MATDRAGDFSPSSSPEAQVFDETTAPPAALPRASPSGTLTPSGAVSSTPAARSDSSAPTPAPLIIPWDQTPEFLASSDWTIHPGAPTEYNPPRAVGKGGPTDVTSFHPAYYLLFMTLPLLTWHSQATWGEDNLPDILYTYKPPTNWLEFHDNNAIRRLFPPPKTDANGNIMYERWLSDANKPDPLLDFPHLPDQIGTKEAWWVFEAWRRYDPRIRFALFHSPLTPSQVSFLAIPTLMLHHSWKDILMRQQYPHRSAAPTNIQALVSHNRPVFRIAPWHPQQSRVLGVPSRGIEWLPEMSEEQRRRNTTRGLTPGLVDPRRGEEGGRVALAKRSRGAGVSRGRRGPARGAKKQAVGKEKEGGDNEAADAPYVAAQSPRPTKRRKQGPSRSTGMIPPPSKRAYTVPLTEATALSNPTSTQNPTSQSSTRFGLHPASEEGRYSNDYQPAPPSTTPAGPSTYRYSPASSAPAAPAAPYDSSSFPNLYHAPGYHGLEQDPKQNISWYPSPLPPPPQPPLSRLGGANAQQYQYPPLHPSPYTISPHPDLYRTIGYQAPQQSSQSPYPTLPIVSAAAVAPPAQPPPPSGHQGLHNRGDVGPGLGMIHTSPQQPPPYFLPTDPENSWMNQYIDFDFGPETYIDVLPPTPRPATATHLTAAHGRRASSLSNSFPASTTSAA
ncbi:MAG: hypothetical protein Q9207_002550 [Kuettlingeria erythrocarpa]